MPKNTFFSRNYKIFQALEAPHPDSFSSGGWGRFLSGPNLLPLRFFCGRSWLPPV